MPYFEEQGYLPFAPVSYRFPESQPGQEEYMEGSLGSDQYPGEGAVLRGCGHCPRGVCALREAGSMTQYTRGSPCRKGVPNYFMSAKLNSQCSQRITSTKNGKFHRKDSRLNSKRTSLHSDSPFYLLFCQSLFLLRCLIHVLPYVILVTFPIPMECFNLDLDTALVQSGEAGSMFGYAVALHKSSQGETS